jgi:hypothetical protein
MKRTNMPRPPSSKSPRKVSIPVAAVPSAASGVAWEQDDDQDMPQHLLPAPWTYGSVEDEEEE